MHQTGKRGLSASPFYSNSYFVPNLVTLMYDTINLRMMQKDLQGVSFLEEVPNYLQNVSFHEYQNDNVIVGWCGNFTISLHQDRLLVKNGSLARFYYGDNIATLSRRDTARAIEKLSDTLHLPIKEAQITRVDVGASIIMKKPVQNYLTHLGSLNYAQRLQQPKSIYYTKKRQTLCFYDKIAEYRQNYRGAQLPELYKGRNVLRYEIRYKRDLSKMFNVSELKASALYDEAFYINALNLWAEAYNQITKINDYTLNFQLMTTKKNVYKMGLLALMEKAGGYNNLLQQIKAAQTDGRISRKTAYDIRQAFKEATKTDNNILVKDEDVAELDMKIKEAIAFYR